MAKSFLPIIATLAYVVWAFLVPAQASIPQVSSKLETHRLPRNVIPLHYDILLNLGERELNGICHGTVSINFQVVGNSIKNKFDKMKNLLNCFKRPEALDEFDAGQCKLSKFAQNQIVVHVDDSIAIKSVMVYKQRAEGSSEIIQRLGYVAHDYAQQMLVIGLENKLEPGSLGRLEFEFEFRPRNDLRGVYERYQNHREVNSRKTEYLFTASRFQPSDARLVMPCFDEPEFKATFNLSLVHSANERALSNTPVLERTAFKKGDSLVLTKFQQTPLMSIHMLAFTVGKYDYLERQQVGKSLTTVRVYTMPGQKRAAEFALEVACKSLLWMEEYTNINYPLDKFDVVAINDHDKDNHESWGLAFIRSNLTLIDEETDPVLKITTAINVAHVVAHQWFGNLITVDWWNQIWITEGIAAHLGFEMVQELYPGFGSEYFSRLAMLSGALDADSDPSGSTDVLMPDYSSLKTSKQISSIFSVNSYMKSASLFRLIMNDLGREQFRRTLQVLLKKNAFGSMNMVDLSRAIRAATGGEADYLTKFAPQLREKSYPIVFVGYFEGKDNSPFVFQENVSANEIGLSCEFGDVSNEHERVLTKYSNFRQGDFLTQPSWFDVSNENHWLKLNPNPDLSTYFRVKYDDRLLIKNMKLAIERKHLSAMDRLNLLDDAVGLVRSGQIAPEILKQLLAHYSHEDHEAVILEMLTASRYLVSLDFEEQSLSPVFKAFLAIFDLCGFEAQSSQSFVVMRAQMNTLTMLVHLKIPEVIEKALQKFDSHNGLVPELHLREPIYKAVVIDGNQDRVEKLIVHLHETSSNDEQMRLIDALLESKDNKVLERLKGWISRSRLTNEMERFQSGRVKERLESV